jgi:probable rRNA maturation factor
LLNLAVEAGQWPGEQTVTSWFDAALRTACDELNISGKLEKGEISVLLTDDASMQAINRDHRGQDKPTNVLSFPGLEAADIQKTDGTVPFLLGDLVFAQETVEREALAADLSVHHHMVHLIVHGFLHLLGYDHELDSEAEAMEALETRILAKLDIADPYRTGR